MLGDEKRQISGEAFHYFNVEELIPANHILRRVDAVLDLSWVRDELRDCYADRGRKSWDPEVIVRMILLGYLYGFSEVRLVDERDDRLARAGLPGESIESGQIA